MALASEAGELLAEYRWVTNSESANYTKTESNRSRVAAEVGDVGIALLLFCDRVGLDLIDAIKDKLATNQRNYPVDRSRGQPERPR